MKCFVFDSPYICHVLTQIRQWWVFFDVTFLANQVEPQIQTHLFFWWPGRVKRGLTSARRVNGKEGVWLSVVFTFPVARFDSHVSLLLAVFRRRFLDDEYYNLVSFVDFSLLCDVSVYFSGVIFFFTQFRHRCSPVVEISVDEFSFSNRRYNSLTFILNSFISRNIKLIV